MTHGYLRAALVAGENPPNAGVKFCSRPTSPLQSAPGQSQHFTPLCVEQVPDRLPEQLKVLSLHTALGVPQEADEGYAAASQNVPFGPGCGFGFGAGPGDGFGVGLGADCRCMGRSAVMSPATLTVVSAMSYPDFVARSV